MFSVFADFGVSVKSALVVLVGFSLIVIAARLGIASGSAIIAAFAVWGVVSFLMLPTRHLVIERFGSLRQLPPGDRRAARLVLVRHRTLFDCVGLAGFRTVNRRVKGKSGYRVESVALPVYPRLSKPAVAPYGFSFRVGLPGCYGITAAKAVNCQSEIDGFISHLLRRASPNVRVGILPVSGSVIELAIHLRDEFGSVVLPLEVELCS
jgi:hypothetical protein